MKKVMFSIMLLFMTTTAFASNHDNTMRFLFGVTQVKFKETHENDSISWSPVALRAGIEKWFTPYIGIQGNIGVGIVDDERNVTGSLNPDSAIFGEETKVKSMADVYVLLGYQGERFTAAAKFGGASTRLGSEDSDNETFNDVGWGAEFRFHIGRHGAMVVDYQNRYHNDNYDTNADGDDIEVDISSIGLAYRMSF